ncbi:lytic murein transglycosylase [Agromyces laixinhei]|uniref:lytic murein transglycosylase n=1 Tax=Agromyces laixinhei TaxID=2585717 RepID=UPI001E2D429A|nr:lytic murein transglycosylase [Agromyces laixinhei]
MSWNDDFDADEYGERRPSGTRATKLQLVRRGAGIIGLVAGATALVIGVVYAVNVVGMATNPDGFAAPDAYGPAVAMPPVTTPDGHDYNEQLEGNTEQTDEPTDLPDAMPASVPSVDPEWIARVAAATGIPERALTAYALAHVLISEEEAECGLEWATIAAIGSIESDHGSHGASKLDESGNSRPAIIGRALDGNGVATIADTDGGELDGDPTWDRAVGPMQFIPSTWAKWAADANGDGAADPHQIDDAALTTARYLCASGPMLSSEGWRAAVYSYNHDNDYVDQVAKVAREFADAAG